MLYRILCCCHSTAATRYLLDEEDLVHFTPYKLLFSSEGHPWKYISVIFGKSYSETAKTFVQMISQFENTTSATPKRRAIRCSEVDARSSRREVAPTWYPDGISLPQYNNRKPKCEMMPCFISHCITC